MVKRLAQGAILQLPVQCCTPLANPALGSVYLGLFPFAVIPNFIGMKCDSIDGVNEGFGENFDTAHKASDKFEENFEVNMQFQVRAEIHEPVYVFLVRDDLIFPSIRLSLHMTVFEREGDTLRDFMNSPIFSSPRL